MKKVYALLSAALFLSVSAFTQTNFPGNDSTGFGGPVGTGSLDISSTGDLITFKLNKGSGGLNDVLVIYIDDATGGFATTSNFTDVTDGLRKAISGYNGTDRATFNFNSDFNPEYALAFQPQTAGSPTGILVTLTEFGDMAVIDNPTFTNSGDQNATDYSITIPAAEIGLGESTPVDFKFIATYISNTAYRSNEAIGDPMTGFAQGWNSYTSTTSPLEYTALLPVVFGNFYGKLQGKAIDLYWDVKTETNTRAYNIQKSSDGNNYITIASIAAKNSSLGASYNYIDNGPINLKNYYRISAVDYDGKVTLSNGILISNAIRTLLRVIGNPAKGSIILELSNPNAAKYELSLYSTGGQKITSVLYDHPGGVSTKTIYIPAGVQGMYYLVAVSNGEKQSMKIFLQ